jgi:SPW repeat
MGLDWVRRHRVTDVVLLVCVIGLATVTWVTSHTDGVSAWRPCFAVSATMFLALAALTPHEPWAVAMRLALSGWLLAAPWLLVLADVPVARWSYLITGLLIAVLSTPYLRHRAAGTDRLIRPRAAPDRAAARC